MRFHPIHRGLRPALLVLFCSGMAVVAAARSFDAGELNARQYAALDRARTAVILTQGMFEVHGNYLPAYTDGYAAARLTQDLSAAMVAHGWNVLVFPALPFGSGGVNEVPARYPFPGTFALRLDTLRTVYMDLADELGEAGFRYIFIVNGHGAPNHNRALDQVGAYFADTWGGHMVNLKGRGAPERADPLATLSEQARQEDHPDGHGGIGETSVTLFLKPDLVDPAFKTAPSMTSRTGDYTRDLLELGKRPDWNGYYGAPRYSSAQLGAKLYEGWVAGYVHEALAVLDGTAPRVVPAQGPAREVDEAVLARDRAADERRQAWMKKNGYR